MEVKVSQKSNRREQRKEKSRNAARSRRKNESDSYQSLIKLLPIDNEILANIDQGTGLCLVNRFMQLRSYLPKCIKDGHGWNYDTESMEENKNYSSIYEDLLKASNGFMLIVDYKCKTLFVSQNTRHHLGVNETDIVGHDLRSLIHEGDHDQVLEFFSKTHVTDKENGDNLKRLFCRVRTSFEVARTGRSKFKSGTGRYQTFNCTFIQFEATEIKSEQLYGVFVQAMPQPTSALTIGVSSSCFLTHHSLDFKFIHNDETELSQTIGYDENDLTGRSFFEYCHPLDISRASQTLANMTKWRQVEFGPYRFLCKRGGWVTLLTQASRVSGNKNAADTIVCLHYICGSIMHEDALMTSKQIDCRDPLNSIDQEISSLFVTTPDLSGSSSPDDRVEVLSDDSAPANDNNDIYGDSVEAASKNVKLEGESDKYLWSSVYDCESLSMVSNISESNSNQDQQNLFSGRQYDQVMGDNDPHLTSTAVTNLDMTGCNHQVIGSLEPVDPYHMTLTIEDQDDGNYEYMAATSPIEMFFEECEDADSICYNAPSIGDPWVWKYVGENKTEEETQDQRDCMLFPEAQVDTTVAVSSTYYQMEQQQQQQQQLGAVPQKIQPAVAALRKESKDSGFCSPSSSPSSNNGNNTSTTSACTVLDASQHASSEITPQHFPTTENINISGSMQMPPQYVMYSGGTTEPLPRNLKRHANGAFPSTVAMKIPRVPVVLTAADKTMRELRVPDNVTTSSYADYDGDNRPTNPTTDHHHQQRIIIQPSSVSRDIGHVRVKGNHSGQQWEPGKMVCTNIANNSNRNAIENLNRSTMVVPDLTGTTALRDDNDFFYYQSYMNKMQPQQQEQYQYQHLRQQQEYKRFRELSKHEISIASPSHPPGRLLEDDSLLPMDEGSLPVLSLNDCEVNAPCTSQVLLAGPIDQLLED